MTIINLQQKGYTLAHWFYCLVQASKEMAVQKDLQRLGLEAYVPLNVKSIRVSRRAKKTRSMTYPIRARTVFVKCTKEQLMAVRICRHVDEIVGARDGTGEPVAIPTPQMVRFQALVENALQAASRAISEGKQVKTKKPRTLKLEELRETNVLESVMAEMFGIETEKEAA